MKGRTWHCEEMSDKTFRFFEVFNDGRIRLNEGGGKRNKTSKQKGKALAGSKRGREGIVKFI